MNKEIRAAKESTVSEITSAFEGAKSVTLVEYRGLNVTELESLRKELRKTSSSFKVFKNTLVEIASNKLGYKDLAEHLKGPNAFIFSNEDEVSAPKVLAKFARKNEALVIKAGVIDGKVLNAKEVNEIAKLPGKNGLLSMFLSCLKAPITKFAATVKAVSDTKQ